MNIWFSDYTLRPRLPLNVRDQHSVRRGRLIRVEFAPGQFGYSDLSRPEAFPLSLEFARLDAKYRAQGTNVFAKLKLPKTHKIITQLESERLPWNYTHYKIKMGYNLRQETDVLREIVQASRQKKLRLDFNSTLTEEQFRQWWRRVSEWLSESLDFIEDPFPYESKSWDFWKGRAPLALDEALKKESLRNTSAEVIVVKPAWFDLGLQSVQPRVVFTNAMDHPLGQMAALYRAAVYYERFPEKLEVGGLRSWEIFEANEFTEYLGVQNDETMTPAGGTGFGFDEILEACRWTPLQ